MLYFTLQFIRMILIIIGPQITDSSDSHYVFIHNKKNNNIIFMVSFINYTVLELALGICHI